MKNAVQTRVLAIVLALATVAACVFAALNFEHENSFDVPTDGIWWVEASGGLRAERVLYQSVDHSINEYILLHTCLRSMGSFQYQ